MNKNKMGLGIAIITIVGSIATALITNRLDRKQLNGVKIKENIREDIKEDIEENIKEGIKEEKEIYENEELNIDDSDIEV